MDYLSQLILKTVLQVWATFTHNWPFLLVSVLIAVGMKLYINPTKISDFLIRYRRAGVVGATVAAVTTPLCSCGTTAIIIGMMASTIPWAPIIAFMVSSPLSSPEGMIYSAGLFGWPFAIAFFISSIVLGLMGGLIGEILERRGWLANQARFAAPSGSPSPAPKRAAVSAPVSTCACDSASVPMFSTRRSVINPSRSKPVAVTLTAAAGPAGEAALNLSSACGCSSVRAAPSAEPCSCARPWQALPETDDTPETPAKATVTWRIFMTEAFTTGRRLLVMFLGFAFVGYFLNGLIPSAWVSAVFGPGNLYSVPLAATLGLPLYINSEASLPLVRALIDGGMSQGSAMAFLITGSGTSIGAIAGAFTIARWRVVATVIGTLWFGAIAMGFLFDFLRLTGIL